MLLSLIIASCDATDESTGTVKEEETGQKVTITTEEKTTKKEKEK
jgi:hypothetical protein